MLATSPPRASGQSALRRMDTRTVLAALREAGTPRRATDLTAFTGLTRATVVTILRELLAAGVVREDGSELHGGRPSPTYSINGAAFPVIGVDVSAGRAAARLSTIDGTQLGAGEAPLGALPGSEVLHAVAGLVERVTAAAGVPMHRLATLCLAAPGIIDAERIVESRSFERWVQTDLISSLGGLLGVPVLLENDANAAALGVRGREGIRESYLALQWGPRLGAGVMLAGELHRGPRGGAGEIGGLTKPQHAENLEAFVGEAPCAAPDGAGTVAVPAEVVGAVADAAAPACAILGLDQVVLTGAASRDPGIAAALQAALAQRGAGAVECLPSPAGEDSVVEGAVVSAAEHAWRALLGR
ncbi:ROK family transcriptional regulator [Galactobacter valiniphilus]|uniref:ROK family transcriptional regulator n=1 Tax=Galactobacter valiniphilus TaxID=2676122 RepID=UPI0037368A64